MSRNANWTPTRLNWCGLKLGSSWTGWPSCNFRFVRQQSTSWFQLQRILGVVLDSQLTMSKHTAYVSWLGFYQLRQPRSIWRSLTADATRALVQAFTTCKLDYCNSVLAGVADIHLRWLQSVQNAAARLVSVVSRRDHIRPVLANLHWLPVHKRVTFKTAVLVWNRLHDAAPCYLMDLCRPVTSADGNTSVRRYHEHCLSRILEQLSARGAPPSMDRQRAVDFRRHSAHWTWRCKCSDVDWRPICSSTDCWGSLESSSSGAVVTVLTISVLSINQLTQLISLCIQL